MSQTTTPSQNTEARRLTLSSRIPAHKLPLTANIPKFTRAPQATSLAIRPLPKPQKIVKPPKPAREKKKEKISNHQKKVLKKRVARLEEERGPLPEPEDGEYDAHGFWVEYPKTSIAERSEDAVQGEDVHLRLRGGHGEEEGREGDISELPMEDNDLAMDKALQELQAMPSGQTFDDLFHMDDSPYVSLGREDRHDAAGPTDTNRAGGQCPKRSRIGAPVTLNDIETGDLPKGHAPTTPHHIADKGRPAAQHPVSAMRGGGAGDDLPDDFLGQYQDYIPMPESAQPRRNSMQGEEDEEVYDDHPMLSPTEMNSSAIREPVSRSQTRRSNSRSRIYSLQAEYQQASEYLPAGQTYPSSFPVSDTQPGSPDSPPIPPTQVGPPQRLKTYSKGSKSVPTRTRGAALRNPAQRREFKDQFSPEPEWEEEHLTPASGKVDRSKRAGSTSWWPESTGPPTPDEGSVDDDEDEDEDENIEGRVRHILGEVQINQRGHRIARGRKRNGEWPEGRDMGLFHEDTQDQEARPSELYRPITERFHLVKEEPQTPLVQNTPPPDFRPRKRHNFRANYDRPIEHPVPQLIMGRQRSVAARVDDYTLKLNSRQSRRQAEIPFNPVVQTNIKSTIKKSTKRKKRSDIPNLPPSVLKPIATVSAEEFKRQLKLRNPGDGFLNPVLIKAGRLGTRDVIIERHQSRIRKTGGRRGVKTQTPIMDPSGNPDPIEVSQATQTPRGEQPGFAVRQLERVRATTARYQKLRPKLPFTSQSPPSPDHDSRNGNRMRFTAQSPPRRSSTAGGAYIPDIDISQPEVRPAQEVLGLAGPRVGFGSRYKRATIGSEETSAPTTTTTVPVPSTERGEGFIRRRPGYQAPPLNEEALPYVGENGTHDGRNDLATGTTGDMGPPSTGRDQYNQGNPDSLPTPLFLAFDEDDDDRDLDSNASRHEPIPDSTTLITPNTGFSGAQLCNNLLQSAANLPIPIKTVKSRREEKREEMARRIKEREESEAPRSEIGGVRLTDRVHEMGPLFDEIENEEEEVELRPTMSQLKRRKEFGFGLGSSDQASVYLSTQVNSEEVDQVSTLAATQAPAQVLPTQLSSFNPEQGPPARNPGRSGRTPSTPTTTTAAGTNIAAINPSATATANNTGTTRLKKTSTTSKHFQPPKAIQKPIEVIRPRPTKRLGPTWATEANPA